MPIQHFYDEEGNNFPAIRGGRRRVTHGGGTKGREAESLIASTKKLEGSTLNEVAGGNQGQKWDSENLSQRDHLQGLASASKNIMCHAITKFYMRRQD